MREDDVEFETFMESALALSVKAKTVTLPLYKGTDGTNDVYYIVTEASDCDLARQFKVNYAPKLNNLLVNGVPGPSATSAVQVVSVDNKGVVTFAASADFTPVRLFTPSSPDGWPPVVPGTTAGAKGGANYSPFITYRNANGKYVVLNASQVATAPRGSKNLTVKDYVPQVDLVNMSATFNLVMGIYDFNFLMYLRMDASDDVVSGFEGGIYAPKPNNAPGNGLRLLSQGSARQTIMPVVNGIRGTNNIYDRQGLQSGALGEGDPLNVLGAKPGDDEYSPIWDVTPVVWTDLSKRQRLHQDDEVRAFVMSGALSGVPGVTGAYNADIGVKSLGVVSNCPVMLRVMKGLLPYDATKK